MQHTTSNFGMTGQQDLYDYFLGRRKKRKKKRNRHGIRLRRKKRNRNRIVQPRVIDPIPEPMVADVPVESPTPLPMDSPPVMTDSSASGYPASEPAPLPVDAPVQEVLPVESESMPSAEPASAEELYAYDDFLGLGRRAKAKIKENRSIRLERRNLKNDERRAGTERLRAETKMLQQMQTSMPVATSPGAADGGSPTDNDLDATPGSEPQQSSPTKTIVIVVAGIIIVSAGILVLTAKNKPHPAVA